MRTAERGLKVIIADGECQLARQRRVRAEDAEKLARGERVVRVRFGVDDEICTGDHSCIRLSGCPSLTVKPNPDPLRSDPVATVIESCVGCGLVRRGRPRRRSVSVVLSRRDHPQSELVGSRALSRSPHRHRLVRSAHAGGARHERAARPADHHPDRRARRRGRRRADRLDRQRARRSLGFPVQSTSIPGVAQRTGATTYYIEIVPVPRHELGGQPAGAGARARHRRCRHRAGERAAWKPGRAIARASSRPIAR